MYVQLSKSTGQRKSKLHHKIFNVLGGSILLKYFRALLFCNCQRIETET